MEKINDSSMNISAFSKFKINMKTSITYIIVLLSVKSFVEDSSTEEKWGEWGPWSECRPNLTITVAHRTRFRNLVKINNFFKAVSFKIQIFNLILLIVIKF